MICVWRLDSGGLAYHPIIDTCEFGNERSGSITNQILNFRVFMLCISIIDISEGPGTPIFGVENEVRKFNQRVDNNSQVVWCYSPTEHKRFSLKCDMDQLSDCQLSKAH